VGDTKMMVNRKFIKDF